MSSTSSLMSATPRAPLPVLPVAAQTADATTAPPLQQGSTITSVTKANQRAPGDARELPPDDRRSATGGPSGGFGRGGASGGN